MYSSLIKIKLNAEDKSSDRTRSIHQVFQFGGIGKLE